MGRLQGKRALVTGAGGGIGGAIARAFVEAGAHVLLTDIDEEVRGVAEALGERASWALQDVTDEAAWPAIVARAAGAEGRLHVLVNNAGIAQQGAVTDISFAQWRRCQSVNLDSVFLGTRAAIPVIAASGGGAIVNISSAAGLVGQVLTSAYCAAKGGVRLFTKAAALDCAAARNGVRINSVHPGIIDTPIFKATKDDHRRGAVGREPIDPAPAAAVLTPLGRPGRADEVAMACLFLASDEASYVTGSELVVDGGYCAR